MVAAPGQRSSKEPGRRIPPVAGAMSVLREKRAELERSEFMMGAERGRLAVALDLLTDSLILVGQHGVYCTSQRNPNKPALDLQAVLGGMEGAKELVQSVMERIRAERERQERVERPAPGAVLEVVEFRVRPEVAEEEFAGYARASTRFLETQPGFVKRRLAKAGDGSWMDQVEWASLAEAQAAAVAFSKEPVNEPLKRAIEPGSARMRYLALVEA